MTDPYRIIEGALTKAVDHGLNVLGGGAIFDWEAGEKLVGVCALGAVLWDAGEARPCKWTGTTLEPPKGRLKAICRILGVNSQWVWRFIQGFCYGNALSVLVQKDGGEWVEVEDDVSRRGLRMRKRFRNLKD